MVDTPSFDIHVKFYDDKEKVFLSSALAYLKDVDASGFCGLTLSEDDAYIYVHEFEAIVPPNFWTSILPIETKYRDQKWIEDSFAFSLAKQYVIQLDNFLVDSLTKVGETQAHWVFRVLFKILRIDDALVGGQTGIYVYVDKLDGHIWNDAEIQKFFKKWSSQGRYELALDALYGESYEEKEMALDYMINCGHKGVEFSLNRFVKRERNFALVQKAESYLRLLEKLQ